MTNSNPTEISNKKMVAGLTGIFLGSLGIHKFVLGYTRAGVIMLVVTLVTCGFGSIVTGLIGLIEASATLPICCGKNATTDRRPAASVYVTEQ